MEAVQRHSFGSPRNLVRGGRSGRFELARFGNLFAAGMRYWVFIGAAAAVSGEWAVDERGRGGSAAAVCGECTPVDRAAGDWSLDRGRGSGESEDQAPSESGVRVSEALRLRRASHYAGGSAALVKNGACEVLAVQLMLFSWCENEL